MPSPSKSLATLCMCLLLLSAAAWADGGKSNGGGASGGGGGSSISCACSDVRPRSGGVGFELGPTCDEVVSKGDCNAGWMQKTISEMKGAPYCQISCGKCPCCSNLDATLRSIGLAPLADAFAAADPAIASALKSPSTSVTLLAPLSFKGGGAAIDAATARRHFLPAANGTGALWTRELLVSGGQVPTLERGAPLLAKGATLSSSVGGPVKAATIVEGRSNIEACKSLIHVVEGAL